MGWYDFAVCFLSLVVVLCHWVGMFLVSLWILWLSAISWSSFRNFICLLWSSASVWIIFAVRVLRFSGLPLASSDYFAFFWVLLPFGLYFAVRVLRFSGLPLASSDYFGFFPGYSVIWSVCLPWIFQFLSRSRVASCWDPADSCELLRIPGLPSR